MPVPPLVSLALSLALTCPATPAPAPALTVPPPGRYSFRSYGRADGLTNPAATLLVQDGGGYVWVGTQSAGVFRYDGDRFRAFTHEQGLPSDRIHSLAAGTDDILWVGTDRGLAWIRRMECGVLSADQGVPAVDITALGMDREGQLWMGTASGLFREHGGEHGGQHGVSSKHFAAVEGWAEGEVGALFLDTAPGSATEGSVFVSHGAQLWRLSESGTWSRWGKEDGLGTTSIRSVIRDRDGRLWVRSVDGLHMGTPEGRFVDRSCLLPSQAHAGPMTLDRNGYAMVPTAEGLVRLLHDRRELVGRSQGLPTDFVNSALEDKEGSLFLASAGLHKQLGRGLWSSYAVPEGLPHSIVWAVARAPSGSLYAGTDSGLARATDHGWETLAGTEGRTFGAIAFGPLGDIWSTGSRALVRVDPTSGHVRELGAAQGLTLSDITLQLLVEPDGRAWVTTLQDGVFRGTITAEQPRFEPVLLVGGQPRERINAMFRDRDQDLWFAGQRGLVVQDSPRPARAASTLRFGKSDGLLDDDLSVVTQRKDGTFCVGYHARGGVSCFQRRRATLVDMTHLELGHAEHVLFLGEDAAGRLWAGSGAGVNILGADGSELVTSTSGAPGDDCAEMAFLAEPSGEVWVGTSTGLGRCAASSYTAPSPPAARIVEAQISDMPVSLPLVSPLRLPRRGASLALRFSVLSYTDEARLSFETRLVGQEDVFRQFSGHQVQFGALSPGQYQFEVRARRDHGPPGPAAVLPFLVVPAWWQSGWVVGLAALGLLGLVYGTARLRLRVVETRNRELEALIATRTADLRQALSRAAEAEKLAGLGRLLAQLSHELNNPTNVIWNNLDPLRGYLDDLETALRRCRALADETDAGRDAVAVLWHELELDFVLSDAGEVVALVKASAQRIKGIHADLRSFLRGEAVEKVEADLVPVLHETVEMLRRGAPRGVRLVESYGTLPRLLFHPGQLGQVALNLLQNAMDAVGGSGEITVEAHAEPEAIVLAVMDTGSGIPEAVRDRIFEPFFTTKDVGRGTGLGLAICHQIVVEHHGGTIALDRDFQGGTRMVVRLPLSVLPSG